MTNQESIKTIELAMAQVEWEYPLDYAAAFTKAINALEKRMPKKPKITGFGVECSNCGSIVDFGPNVARLNGCPWCLQAIDWSEVKE